MLRTGADLLLALQSHFMLDQAYIRLESGACITHIHGMDYLYVFVTCGRDANTCVKSITKS